MTGFLVVASITYMALHNYYNPERLYVCLASLWLTSASYLFYQFGPYDQAVELMGYYQYQSITPFMCIICLSFISGRLSTLLMISSFACILANIGIFWLEGLGVNAWSLYQAVLWVILIVELVMMYSPRLTDVLHGSLHGSDMAGNHSKSEYLSGNSSHCLQGHKAQDQK